jgi:hypothetical protein
MNVICNKSYVNVLVYRHWLKVTKSCAYLIFAVALIFNILIDISIAYTKKHMLIVVSGVL